MVATIDECFLPFVHWARIEIHNFYDLHNRRLAGGRKGWVKARRERGIWVHIFVLGKVRIVTLNS